MSCSVMEKSDKDFKKEIYNEIIQDLENEIKLRKQEIKKLQRKIKKWKLKLKEV